MPLVRPSSTRHIYRYGCSDPLALNYDPEANTSTNTCVYPEGCTNDIAINYDADAIVDDGSCEFLAPDEPTVYRYGCSDPLALNYDPEVNTPTNTCVYPEGCTNITAANFDENAMVDDGSCIFEGTNFQTATDVFNGMQQVCPSLASYFSIVDWLQFSYPMTTIQANDIIYGVFVSKLFP